MHYVVEDKSRKIIASFSTREQARAFVYGVIGEEVPVEVPPRDAMHYGFMYHPHVCPDECTPKIVVESKDKSQRFTIRKIL